MFSEGDYWVGFYGGGIIKPTKPYKLVDRKPLKTKFNKTKIFSVAQNNFPKLPAVIKPPTIDKLKLMQAKLNSAKRVLPKVYATAYNEDWKTQGDWIGRAFRDWAVLCAVTAPFDHPVYFSTEYYSVREFIGPNYREKDDAIRRWIHWIKTDNPKTLYDPWYGYRRQAEWDDHGEAYPLSLDGPDIWIIVRIEHKGVFKVGMYFFNKDGHSGNNRLRDYSLEIYSAPENFKLKNLPQDEFAVRWHKYAVMAESQVRAGKLPAKQRVRDFWGGVHKQFVVTGPAYYLIKIDRNYSYNTIVSGVYIDRLHGKPTTHENKTDFGIPMLCQVEYYPPQFPYFYESREGRHLSNVWDACENSYNKYGAIELQRKYRLTLYQGAERYQDLDKRLEPFAQSLKWQLNIWDEEQRIQHQKIMKRAHKRLLKQVPSVKDAIKLYE
jgi:hypothetical protein